MRFSSKQARQIGLITWALLTAQCATAAEDAEYVTKSGQPLCRTADDLKAYMQAAMLNDKTEWDCELLRAGLRLQIEEVVGRSEDLEWLSSKLASKRAAAVHRSGTPC